MSTADEIKKLNELLRERVISQEEFDAEKDKLLKKSSPDLILIITGQFTNKAGEKIARI